MYWGNNGGGGSVGRANLDGTGVNQSFIASAGNGVAVDGTHVYWVRGGPCAIGRANLDRSGVNSSFITGLTTSCPILPAVDGSHVYWTDLVEGTIGRANLDGSSASQTFITDGPGGAGRAAALATMRLTRRGGGLVALANLSTSARS